MKKVESDRPVPLTLLSCRKAFGRAQKGRKGRRADEKEEGEILANLVHDSRERTAFSLSLALLSRSLLCTAGWKGGF